MVTRIFCDPGDVVLAEGPSYVGALGTFAAYQADVVHVAMDDDGLVPEALRRGARRGRVAPGERVKFLYTIPNFHNPAGVTLAVARRAEILEICRAHRVLVVEDNPYGLLGFDGQTYPALRSMDPDNVVYLGSFSKTFAAGLRVGWVLAPHAVREKLVLAAESATLCPPDAEPDDRLALPRDARLEGPDQVLPVGVPRDAATRCCPRWSSTCRAGCSWTRAGRRLLRVDDRAGGRGHQGDAAARGHRPGRVRVRHRLLRRRVRQPADAAVVLLPDAGAHPGGRAPARGRARRRAGAVRTRSGRSTSVRGSGPQVPGPDIA